MIASEEEARAWVRQLPQVDEKALARLELLITLLREENQKQNLVAAQSLDTVWQRHIADSAQLLAKVPRGTSPWMDLGTGAGFPGLVVAALDPAREVLLVESRKRRIEWLSRAAASMELPNVVIHGSRLEEVPTRVIGVISARAFAPLDRLVTLSARFSTADTIWLLPKGRSAQQELEMLRGWNHMFHVEQSVTDPEAGIIVGSLLGKKGKGS